MTFSFAQALRKSEHKNLSGSLRPSGRFSFAQIFPKKKKVLNDGRKIEDKAGKVRSVQELDWSYKDLLAGGQSVLPPVSPEGRKDSRGIGSSIAANSRKRGSRGSRGISSSARDVLCWAANQLERVYRRANMSFLTLTLPELSVEALGSVQADWSKIVKDVVEEIKRELGRRGLQTAVVGCTELQLERGEKDGRSWPHLHLVFRGRYHSNAQWAISHKGFRAIWRRCVGRVVACGTYDWSSSENVQQVSKSCGGYLAKYISKNKSKGSSQIRDHWHPSDWIICSRRLRSLYSRLTISGYDIAQTLAFVCNNWMPGMGYRSDVIISTPVYGDRIIGKWGWLRGEEKFLTPMEWFALT